MEDLLAMAARDMEEVQADMELGLNSIDQLYADMQDEMEKYSAAISTMLNSGCEQLEVGIERVALADGTTVSLLKLLADAPQTMGIVCTLFMPAGFGMAMRRFNINIQVEGEEPVS